MRCYFAPLEGITGYIFRNAHKRHFSGVDKYFAPFISTNQNHAFSNKEMRDILPENNEGVSLVPQLLGKVAEDFISAAKVLEDMGYSEVNLNLGCPSGTVAAKGKGSGALADTDKLSSFLEEIFQGTNIKISIKTRLGIKEPEEFGEILEIFNRYPVSELIIHPRVQRDFYKNTVNLDAFEKALSASANPVCYNGDINTPDDCGKVLERFPKTQSIMIGRGLVSDPALAQKLCGGSDGDKNVLQAFHDEIYSTYRQVFRNDRNAIMRMKEFWSLFMEQFNCGEKQAKKMRKVTSAGDYEALAAEIFSNFQ
jgi:tRNA-dihydrouridine synthase